jgi:hypothetical protein
MKYIQVNKDLWVEVDEQTKKTVAFNPKDLQGQLSDLTSRLQEIPKEPTDRELLAWARVNYPQMDYSNEKKHLGTQIDIISNQLKNIK